MLFRAIIGCFMALTLFCSAAPALADTGLEAELTDIFKRYVVGITNGDMATFRALRLSSKVQALEERLAKKGKVLQGKHLKSRHYAMTPEVFNLKVIQALQKKGTARLAFYNDGGEKYDLEPSQVEIVFVLFQRETEQWKVDIVGPHKFSVFEIGRDHSFPEEKVTESFRLPE